MEKQGAKRFYPEPDKNDVAPVSELSVKVRKKTEEPHQLSMGLMGSTHRGSMIPNVNQVPAAFPAIDNDLAAENMLDGFDMTAADLQDLQR